MDDQRISKVIASDRERAAEYERHACVLQKLINARVDLLGVESFREDAEYLALCAGYAALTVRAVDARADANRLEKLTAPLG